MSSKTSFAGLLAGLAFVGVLVAWQGLDQVAGILGTAGWSLLLVCLLAPPEALLASEAWRHLFPSDRKPGIWQTLCASWMGVAVNTLLPVATIGGEIVKARVLTLWGSLASDTVSTTIVDKTVQAIVILFSGLIGIAVLATLVPAEEVLLGGLIGAVALALGIGGFVAVQLLGSFTFLANSGARLLKAWRWQNSAVAGERLDDAIRAIYRRPGAIALACGLRMAGSIWLVSEIVLASHLLGQPIGLPEAIMLRALVGAIRGLLFVVPAGLGLQEGGYVALGALIGLPADLMLALSLASRVREIAPAIPFLILWQHIEGRALWRRHLSEECKQRS
jgi:putative membrane protein